MRKKFEPAPVTFLLAQKVTKNALKGEDCALSLKKPSPLIRHSTGSAGTMQGSLPNKISLYLGPPEFGIRLCEVKDRAAKIPRETKVSRGIFCAVRFVQSDIQRKSLPPKQY